jgi:ADP-ribose pyrophosphatase
VARQVIHRGKKIQVALDTTALPDGSVIQRDVILHPGAAAILPMIDAEHVCLVRNHRPTVGQTLLEIPAGTLDPGESPEDAAIRELAEETGFRAAQWRRLTVFLPSPGVLDERTHLFLAMELKPGEQRPEKDEQLEPHILPWKDAMEMALDGSISDAKTLIALLLWERLRART